MRTTDWAAQRLRLASRTFINLDRISRDSGELFRKPSPTTPSHQVPQYHRLHLLLHLFLPRPLCPSAPFSSASQTLSCRTLPLDRFTRKLRAKKPSERIDSAPRRERLTVLIPVHTLTNFFHPNLQIQILRTVGLNSQSTDAGLELINCIDKVYHTLF